MPEKQLKSTPPFSEESVAGTIEGIVLRAVSGQYVVQPTAPESEPLPYLCTLRGNLKKDFTYNTSLSVARRVIKAKRPWTKDTVAIGDRVLFVPGESLLGTIEEILPRTSRFARQSFRGKEQTLVTNLDQLAIVFACTEPNPDPWRIDRWLVAAEYYELEPLLLANKCDLVSEEVFEERFREYKQLGYTVLRVSAHANIGIETLREAMRGRVAAFTGPSGVGKSSLLNALQPGLKLDTGDIGYTTFKGRHTTTMRELIPLESGGWVADTPGLRKIELLKMSREELIDCYCEFREYLEEPCKFRDCKHEREPSCNIKIAVEKGAISERRYQSFLETAREMGE